MNPTPAPEADGPLTSHQRGQDGPDKPLAVEAGTVPRQKVVPRAAVLTAVRTPAAAPSETLPPARADAWGILCA